MNKVLNKKRGKTVAIVDGLIKTIYPICKLFENKKRISLSDVKKILVINFGYLGDTLISFPAIESLRNAYPKSRIDLLINPKFKDIWKYNYDYDNLIEYDVPWIRYGFKLCLKDIINYFKKIKKIKKEKYDMVIDLRGDLRNIFLLVYKSKAPIRAGYGITGGDYLLTNSIKFPNLHEVENNLALSKSLGGKKSEYELEIGKEEFKKIESLLNSIEKEIIIILPSAGYPTKEWEIEKWIELVDKLNSKYQIILAGAKGDKNISSILKYAKTKPIEFTGKSLNEVGALMTKSKLVIGCDSGGMHLASIVGAKTIELMGPTDINRWKAYKNCTVISKYESCSPCGLYNTCNQKLKRKCMKKIKVQEILNEVR